MRRSRARPWRLRELSSRLIRPPGPPAMNAGSLSPEPPGRVQARRSPCWPITACAPGLKAWAKQVAKAFTAHEADSVVAESNQGGEMVRAVLAAALPGLPVRLVHASRAKRARAEPVATLYATGRVAHAARMTELEDQMCAFGAPEFSGSPDRVDALVWAIAALKGGGAEPRLRWI